MTFIVCKYCLSPLRPNAHVCLRCYRKTQSILNYDLPVVQHSKLFKKLLFSILIALVVFSIIYIFYPSIFNKITRNIFDSSIPQDVLYFVEKKKSCDHFLGESGYDAEREKFLRENIKKFCPETDRELDHLLKKYIDNKAVIKKLSEFSIVENIDTGPTVIGQRYQDLRKTLFKNKWRPWKFIPLNNYSGPFPEVMSCSEGYCNGYFINKENKNLILRILYKYCGSDYVGSCQGHEDGVLIVEDYEILGLEEAKIHNEITKSHFDHSDTPLLIDSELE